MRISSAVALCIALVVSGLAISFSGSQVKSSPSLPVSAIELKTNGLSATGYFMPFSQCLVLRPGRAEWASTSVPRVGKYVGQAAAYDWERLVKFLDIVQFDQMKPNYGSEADDIPEYEVTVHRGPESQSVTCYGEKGPVQLWAVRMSMRGIADSIEWASAPTEAGK